MIITAGEIVRYNYSSSKLQPALLQPHIKRKEESFANEVLGFDFYEALKADLVDVSGAQGYNGNKIYALGEKVVFYGLTLESLANNNTVNPCEDSAGVAWAPVQKFNSDCYEALYNGYLREAFCITVLSAALPHLTYPISSKGLSEWVDDGTGARSAGLDTVSSRAHTLRADAEEVVKNMQAYMNREVAAGRCAFTGSLLVQNDNCEGAADVQRPGSRRFYFKKSNW